MIGAGRRAEWAAEDILANPTIGFAVPFVAVTVTLFIGLSWMAEAILGLPWLEAIFALGAALFLIQGMPSDMNEFLSPEDRRRFFYPVWMAGSLVLFGLMLSYLTVSNMSGPVRWWFLGAVCLVIGPIVWFARLQILHVGRLVAPGSIRWGTALAVVAHGLPGSLMRYRRFHMVRRISFVSCSCYIWSCTSQRGGAGSLTK